MMNNRTWAALFAVILVICGVLSFLFLRPGENAAMAEIWSEGKLVRTVDLAVDQEITVDSGDGINVVTVKDGKIAVTQADCPDGYCMKRGFCSGGTQIVCLPNRLVIEFISGQAVDAAVG